MPNWVSNDLIVTATKKFQAELKYFKEFAKLETEEDKDRSLEVLNANNFIPSPYNEISREKIRISKISNFAKRKDEEILFNLKYGGKNENEGWYDWNVKNWGSKWNFCSTCLAEETDKKLFYTFDSAWSPMLPVICAMAKKYPNLKFNLKYYERGMGFSGSVVLHNNKVIKDSHNNNYRGWRGG